MTPSTTSSISHPASPLSKIAYPTIARMEMSPWPHNYALHRVRSITQRVSKPPFFSRFRLTQRDSKPKGSQRFRVVSRSKSKRRDTQVAVKKSASSAGGEVAMQRYVSIRHTTHVSYWSSVVYNVMTCLDQLMIMIACCVHTCMA